VSTETTKPEDEAAAGAVPEGERPWFRMHFAGRLLADLRWLGQQFQVSVMLLPEAREVGKDCCTGDLDLAKLRADRMVREAFPHTCDKEDCGPWVPYSR